MSTIGKFHCSIFFLEPDDDNPMARGYDPENSKRHVNGKFCIYAVNFYSFLFIIFVISIPLLYVMAIKGEF